MYKNNCLMSICLNGNQLREFYDEEGVKSVYLPIGSEYTILLRNDTDRRARVTVKIDGKNICARGGSLVVRARDSLMLERFVNKLKSGRKFKLVKSNHPEVQDPMNLENGYIDVEWRFEEVDNDFINRYYFDPHYEIKYYTVPERPLVPWYCMKYQGGYFSDGIDTATIEGTRSDQSFTKVSGKFESFPSVTMRIKLIGYEDTELEEDRYNQKIRRYCRECGRKVKSSDKYCAYCGTKL